MSQIPSSQSLDKTIVISLGGSMLVPNGPDKEFLAKFTQCILDFIQQGFRFCIIVGGGSVAREYQEVLRGASHCTNEDVDWIGIHATRFNAELVRRYMGSLAYSQVVWFPFSVEVFESFPVVVGAGHEPGNSSDLGAVLAACEFGASRVINLSNIEYVYSADPKVDSHAFKLERLTWNEYLNLIPTTWSPGMSTPFDPIASRKAQECGVEVAMIYGKNLESMRDYIQGKEFSGTRIV